MKKIRLIACAIAVVLVVVAVILPVMLLTRRDGQSSISPSLAPSLAPSSSPTSAPTMDFYWELVEYLEDVPGVSKEELFVPGSPQFRALQWMARKDTFLFALLEETEEAPAALNATANEYVLMKIRQRYALATLHFAFHPGCQVEEDVPCGPKHGRSNWLVVDQDECDWYGLECSGKPGVCQDSCILTEIRDLPNYVARSVAAVDSCKFVP